MTKYYINNSYYKYISYYYMEKLFDDRIWIEKYKPTTSSEIIGNSNAIHGIKNWLDNFNNEKTSGSIIISGNHGIGKTMSVRIILEEYGYKTKILNSNNIKNQKVIDEILQTTIKSKNVNDLLMGKNNTKYALIIDDTETISLATEKNSLLNLYKDNDKMKYFPIIFISNLQHNKLISDIKKTCLEFKFYNPTKDNLLFLIKKIVAKEKMTIVDDDVFEKIISFSQTDIRRLIQILHDIYLSYGTKKITSNDIKEFIHSSQKKDIDIGLFDATKRILNSYTSIPNCLMLYEMEKVLLPLTIHENYYKSLLLKHNSNDKVLDIMRSLSDSISQGDVIETNIYTDQNWYLQNIHGFFTCVKTSYDMNKYPSKMNKHDYMINFSSDLNKSSLKNINKKNITNLQLVFPKKSIDDILYINKIMSNLIKNNDFEKICEIVKQYKLNVKDIEVAIKIDKTDPVKINISPKNKKILTNLIK